MKNTAPKQPKVEFSLLKGLYMTDEKGKRHMISLGYLWLQLLFCCIPAVLIGHLLFPDPTSFPAILVELVIIVGLYLLTSVLLLRLGRSGATWLFEKKARK
ncbi:MAG: hypothetical protein IK127_05160 [Clostridia bacterium]|nr:hypothetical protein [Clostridia bacterium]